MTRRELIRMAHRIWNNNWFDNRHETAVTAKSTLYHYNAYGVDLLRSYDTLVGIYKRDTAALYVFGTYNHTTVKHIYKAAKMLNAIRITWLYPRRDRIVETVLYDLKNPFRVTSKELQLLCDCDWKPEIPTKWNVPENLMT